MAAELPRCAVCRTRVEPGVTVTFRDDGRVEHAACPKVSCPVCANEIRPHEPIRRDGEAMLHGNCWVRRSRLAARVVAGGADVAAVIRAKLSNGALPVMSPTRVWGSTAGDGAVCSGCGESLGSHTEYEVEFAGTVSVRFHRLCYGIWEDERDKLARGIGGGSACSPWTLFFDLGVSRRSGRDAALWREMLVASAETRAASAAVRDGAVRARLRAVALRAAARRARASRLPVLA